MKAIVVIPTYNEAENIGQLIPQVLKQLKKSGADGRIIVVDDSSPDGTADIVKSLKEKKLTLIEREGKQGLGTAYVAGFKEALKQGGDLIFEMDADFSHKPEYIPEFIEKAKDFDLVIGTRYEEGGKRKNWPKHRWLISGGANMLIKLIASLPVRDVTTGYRVYRKEVLETIDLDKVRAKGYEFQLEMLYKTHKLGFSIGNVPIIFESRKAGKSKLAVSDMVGFFMLAFKLRLGFL